MLDDALTDEWPMPCRDCGEIDGQHSERCIDVRDRRETREDKVADFYRGDQ